MEIEPQGAASWWLPPPFPEPFLLRKYWCEHLGDYSPKTEGLEGDSSNWMRGWGRGSFQAVPSGKRLLHRGWWDSRVPEGAMPKRTLPDRVKQARKILFKALAARGERG